MGALSSIPIAMFLKIGNKGWLDGTGMESIFPKLPWMDQMGLTALITMAVIILVSYRGNKGAEDEKELIYQKEFLKHLLVSI